MPEWKQGDPTEPGLYLVLWNNQDYSTLEVPSDEWREDLEDIEQYVKAHYGPIPKPPEGL
jgi:hypothetical protein